MGTMVNRLATCGAVMLVTAATADAARKVKVEPTFEQGETFTYQMAMHLGVSQTKGTAPTNDSTIVSSATVTITINTVDKDGSADAEMVVDQVDLTGMMDGREAGYSWPVMNGIPDDAPAIAHLGETLCNSTVKLYISASGAVGVMGGLDDFVVAAQQVGGTDSRLLGFFSPETLGTTLSPLFTVDGARERKRRVGSSWTTNDFIPMAPIGLMTITNKFTFDSFDDDMMHYTGKTTFKFKDKSRRGNSMAKIQIVEQSGTTNAAFNTETNRMDNRSSEMMMRTRWVLGGMSMEQTQRSVTTFKLVDDAE